MLAQLYGGELDSMGRTFATVGAGITLGFGLIDWSVRDVRDLEVRRGVLIGNLVAVSLVALALFLATASGAINALGWVGAFAHAALAGVVAFVLRRVP